MARYFFNIDDGVKSQDGVGSECATSADVRTEAVETMQELLKDSLLMRGDNYSMTINVVDQDGKTVMLVSSAASVEVIQGSSLTA